MEFKEIYSVVSKDIKETYEDPEKAIFSRYLYDSLLELQETIGLYFEELEKKRSI